jgi:hypothetical protein
MNMYLQTSVYRLVGAHEHSVGHEILHRGTTQNTATTSSDKAPLMSIVHCAGQSTRLHDYMLLGYIFAADAPFWVLCA